MCIVYNVFCACNADTHVHTQTISMKRQSLAGVYCVQGILNRRERERERERGKRERERERRHTRTHSNNFDKATEVNWCVLCTYKVFCAYKI